MNKRIKKKWIKALRSGKFTQNRNGLKNGWTFSASGILCDIFLKESGIPWKQEKALLWPPEKYSDDYDYRRLSYCLGRYRMIPQEVVDWAEVKHWTIPLEGHSLGSVAVMNRMGKSFKEIADAIEEKL